MRCFFSLFLKKHNTDSRETPSGFALQTGLDVPVLTWETSDKGSRTNPGFKERFKENSGSTHGQF